MRSFTSLTIRNLTAHPLRSILTALAITLGVAMVLAAAIVGQAANRSAVALSEQGPQVDLEIFARDGDPFQENILATLRAHPDVAHASPSLRVEASGIDPPIDHLTLAGVNPEAYQSLHRPELAGGAFLNAPNTIVLPIVLALKHNLNIGDGLTLKTRNTKHETRNFTLSGHLKLNQDLTALDKNATASLEAVQSLAGTPGQIDRIEVTLRPGAKAESVKADLSQQLDDRLAVVQVREGVGVGVNALLMQTGLAMVGLIILLAAGFVIMNAFAMTITGRTREIGALRALGMTRRQVMRSVLLEAALMGSVGAIGGTLLGLGPGWGVRNALVTVEDGACA
ncbi:MAG: ABC transporter permease, partial [Anaerolineae bacterium]